MAAILHVRPQGSDAQAGTTWESAKATVTAALSQTRSGDEIWVAAGTYSEHVQMTDGVALLGGFAGTEDSSQQRLWLQNRTVLDGTTNGVVVTFKRCGPETVIDGFTIQNGSGTGVACLETAGKIQNNLIRGNVGNDTLAYGGGIFVSGAPTHGVLTIQSNRVTDNANFDGGGIACIDASPRILRNVITWNLAYQNGGGISCWKNSSPTIANNLISGNTASWIIDMPVPVGGGGIFATADDLDGRPHPTAVSAPVLVNNMVAANGGWLGGGIALVDSNGGLPAVINNTIVANNGSGIFWGSSASETVGTKPRIANNVVAYNPWGLERAEGTPSNPNIAFNCVYGNQLQGTRSDYRGLPDWTGTNGNISLDPRLANYQFGQLHLQLDSPCIDAGNGTEELEDLPDIDGQARVRGKAVDMGADESDGTFVPSSPPVLHVSPHGSDTADGLTWATAKTRVQSGIEAAKLVGGEVWVAAGTYREHIVLPAFVYLYGGFSGTESDRGSRSLADHKSILDGEGAIKVVQCGNAGYLVSALDGFTIQNGGHYTAGAGLNKYGVGGLGGGIYIGVSSPSIANNLITHNSLAQDNSPSLPQPASYGAGIYCELSYALIEANTIQDNEILNTFDGSGGGIYSTHSMPVIQRNTFARNHAKEGAAIYSLHSTPIIRDNLVVSNAMYNTYPLPLYQGSASGAITLSLAPDFLIDGNVIQGNIASAGAGIQVSVFRAGRVQNNLFFDNRADEPTGIGGMGGGLYCMVSTNATQTVAIVNNTFVGNVATTPFGEQGGAIAFTLVPPANKLVIANNLIVSNSSGIYQTPTTPMSQALLLNNNLLNRGDNYRNLTAGATDSHHQPLFDDAANGLFTLRSDSPGIDGGSTNIAPAWDKDRTPRPLDGDGNGVALPDVGAFETVLATSDSDRDSMRDGWELENLLNPTVDDAARDQDGDGLRNADERTAGTNPTQASSSLNLETILPVTGERLTIRWPSVAGRLYAIEVNNGFAWPAAWQLLEGNLAGTGTVLEWSCPIQDATSRIYRVQVRVASP